MANTDSFIDEVSEEVRRDRLFSLFKRWGWVPILLVLAVVGGAAYLEWQRASEQAEAEMFGDALLAALEGEDPEGRIAALAEIETPSPEAELILALLAAGEISNADDAAGAAARLRTAAETPGLARRYVDLALLKAQMLDPAPEAEARLILETIAAPGAPYAPLAEEQLALMEIRAGDLEAGLDRLRAIERSAAATAGLQQRASQLIVALESGASLLDTAPEGASDPGGFLVPGAVPLGGGADEEADGETDGETDGEAEPAPTEDDETPAEDPAPAVEE